ncbi:MAG TPA: T9SS type A sorting domain-containing protein, partial [Bacteroidia bacterium]|nr:T9SS type A sorting domain-containing protein [Bacteroidia bacterium]
PVNNMFNQSGTFNYVEIDATNTTPSSNQFQYFYSNSTPNIPNAAGPNECTASPFPILISCSTANNCPSELVTTICYTCVVSHIASSEKEVTKLQNEVDGGNTSGLLNLIATGTPDQINKALMAASPYLSDAVLVSAVKAGLPPGMIQNIIVANSPVDVTVLNAVDSANLPKGTMKNIMKAQKGVSPMIDLNAEIGAYRQAIGEDINKLISGYMHDPKLPYPQNVDSAIKVYQTYDVPDRLCQLTAAYVSINDTTNAKAAIAAQTSGGYPLDSYCQILQILMTLRNQPGGVAGLPAQPAMMATVQRIAVDTVVDSATGNMDRASALAQGIIEQLNAITRLPVYIMPIVNTPPSHKKTDRDEVEEQDIDDNMFVVYPNPNTGKFQMGYTLSENETGSVELYNYMGSKVKTYNLDPASTTLQINETGLAAGMYLYRVIVNDEVHYTGKVMIMK